jgi:hypothetical protein
VIKLSPTSHRILPTFRLSGVLECFNVGDKGPGCVVIKVGGREGFARATLVEESAAVVGWVRVLSIRVHGSWS